MIENNDTPASEHENKPSAGERRFSLDNQLMYSTDFIEKLQEFGNRYAIEKLTLETFFGRQTFMRGDESPQLELVKDQVIVRKGRQYLVRDISDPSERQAVYDAGERELRERFKKYYYQSRDRHREASRLRQREYNRRKREQRDEVTRRK